MRVRRLLRRVIVDYCVGSIVLAILLAELAFHPQRITVVDAARARAVLGQVGAELREVATVPADGVRLDAWFALPQRTNGDAVILLHGVGDSRQGMIHFASLFAARGYSVLMPDSRGHGTSGGVTTYGIREAGDLGVWYGWLRAHSCSGCVFGLGESMGAAILRHHMDVFVNYDEEIVEFEETEKKIPDLLRPDESRVPGRQGDPFQKPVEDEGVGTVHERLTVVDIPLLAGE